MTSPIRIIIVDINEAVRNGLCAYLDTLPDFEVVGEATSGEKTQKLVNVLAPDIVLIDPIMLDEAGDEIIYRIKYLRPSTQVVVLTSHYKEEYIILALKAGAISYVLKDVKMKWLVDIMHRASKDELSLHPRVAAYLQQIIYSEEGDNYHPLNKLSSCEQEVFSLIAKGQTYKQISEKLETTESMVKSHVSKILYKLFSATQ